MCAPAEPGEFTRRAFENGKLDLTEAEGLDDLIHADTDRQRRQALRQLKGLLGDKARDWRARIIEASALIEAGIDFSDEGDVPAELIAPALAKVKALLAEIEEVLAAQGRSERLRDGLVVAIAGPPNVGKSTLMNQLARREVAIVSPHAGTTRDVIEVQLDLDGYPVTVIDTAGIRETDDPVEQEGVRRARARAADADLVLWLADVSTGGDRARRRRAGLDGAQQDRSRCGRSANGRGVGQGGCLQISAQQRRRACRVDRGLGRFRARLFWRQRGWLDRPDPAAATAAGDGGSLQRGIEVVGQGEELAAEEIARGSAFAGAALGARRCRGHSRRNFPGVLCR